MKKRPWDKNRIDIPVLSITLIVIGICFIALAFGKYWMGQNEPLEIYLLLDDQSEKLLEEAKNTTSIVEKEKLLEAAKELRYRSWKEFDRASKLRDQFIYVLIIGITCILAAIIRLVLAARKKRNY